MSLRTPCVERRLHNEQVMNTELKLIRDGDIDERVYGITYPDLKLEIRFVPGYNYPFEFPETSYKLGDGPWNQVLEHQTTWDITDPLDKIAKQIKSTLI